MKYPATQITVIMPRLVSELQILREKNIWATTPYSIGNHGMQHGGRESRQINTKASQRRASLDARQRRHIGQRLGFSLLHIYKGGVLMRKEQSSKSYHDSNWNVRSNRIALYAGKQRTHSGAVLAMATVFKNQLQSPNQTFLDAYTWIH